MKIKGQELYSHIQRTADMSEKLSRIINADPEFKVNKNYTLSGYDLNTCLEICLELERLLSNIEFRT